MLAGSTAALLLGEQVDDHVGALTGGEWRTLVAWPLGARGRVGAHLHELGRGVLTQLCAELGRAARVAHGVVECEPRLRRVAPDDGRVEDRARRRTACAHGVPVPLGSPAASSRARRRCSLRADISAHICTL